MYTLNLLSTVCRKINFSMSNESKYINDRIDGKWDLEIPKLNLVVGGESSLGSPAEIVLVVGGSLIITLGNPGGRGGRMLGLRLQSWIRTLMTQEQNMPMSR